MQRDARDTRHRVSLASCYAILCAAAGRQISIAHTLTFIDAHKSTSHLRALCVLCARKKVGSVKSEVGSEVGSMTEPHFIQRRSVFPMRDNELKTPLRSLSELHDTVH
jgi:hypothetical protein